MHVRVRLSGAAGVLRLAANVLILAGVCASSIWAWAFLEGAWYQYIQGIQFARTLAGEDSGVAAPKSPAQTDSASRGSAGNDTPVPEAPVPMMAALPKLAMRLSPSRFRADPRLIGRLEGPGLSVLIREGVDEDTLRKAAGHLPESALPGEPGNFVLLGHRDTFFRGLRNLQRGDSIRVATRAGQFRYVVQDLEVTEPEAVRIQSSADRDATLITCFPFNYIGPAPRRFVVHARLADNK